MPWGFRAGVAGTTPSQRMKLRGCRHLLGGGAARGELVVEIVATDADAAAAAPCVVVAVGNPMVAPPAPAALEPARCSRARAGAQQVTRKRPS